MQHHAHGCESVRVLSLAIGGTVELANTLVRSGRPVELQGLDRDVGLLCAKALDLPPEIGRTLLPELQRLAGLIDDLHAALSAAAPCG